MKLISSLFSNVFLVLAVFPLFALGKPDPSIIAHPSKNHSSLDVLLDSIQSVRKKNLSESVRLAAKAIRLADSLSEPVWKARFHFNEGVSFRMMKLYDEALKSQFEALTLFQQSNDTVNIANSMYEIGSIYADLGDYEQALSHHFNALYLREYDNNSLLQAKSYLAIGNLLMQTKEYWRALDFLLNARIILEKESDTSLLAASLVNLGELMIQMQRYNEAADHIDKAIALSTNETEKAGILLLKANLLMQINKPDQALRILLDIHDNFRKVRDFPRIIAVNTLMRDIFTANKNFEKALYHANLVSQYSDSLQAIQRMEEVARLQLIFETRELIADNKVLKLQLKKADLENRRNGLLISLLLLGIIVAISIHYLLRNRRLNRQLQQMNFILEQKVEERSAELRQQSSNLQNAYTALNKSENLFRAINETVPLGVAVTDTDGRITIYNQHLIALGFKKKELETRHWFIHIVPEDQEKILSLWDGAHRHRKPLPETLFRITLNNTLKYLRLRGNCLELEGEFNGMVIVMEDFSAIIKNEQDLIKSRKKAEESDRLKSAFLANMSHEIRTPMNAILGFADLLSSDEYTNQEKQEFINTIQSSGQLLLNLINDIIDISKIEAGELKIFPTTFDLSELLETQFQTFKNQLESTENQNVRLILSNREAIRNCSIYTDKLRLQQILTNLLSNAIKFTQEGVIEFGVIGISDQYQFYVKDTGIGIPESKQDVIFERFRQADDAHTKQYGGTGLGLSISLHLTHLLGGKMWVESVVDKGTTFYFTLPRPVESKSGLTDVPDYSNRKVLVVEDVEANFHLINTMLRRSNATVLHAPNGYIAIALVQSEQPDLVLMDIQLPEMDGLEALKNLRKMNFTRPVVAITAFALAGDAQFYLRQGFDSYLSKPIGIDKLYQMLRLFFDPETSLIKENDISSHENQKAQ
jgi:PAS domain S-box-containing protein